MPLQITTRLSLSARAPPGGGPLSIPHAPISPPWCSKAVNRVGALTLTTEVENYQASPMVFWDRT